jgi:hypothetical protein
MQLSQLMVTGTGIGKDFYAIQTHQSVGAERIRSIQLEWLRRFFDSITHEAGVNNSSQSCGNKYDQFGGLHIQ